MHVLRSIGILLFFYSQSINAQIIPSAVPAHQPGTMVFWSALQQLCGQAFKGEVIRTSPTDTLFIGKRLIMHVRACREEQIRIPFFVGDDRSRTWVITLGEDRILLKHDHRHPDGREDHVTQYGGWSTHSGADTLQIFPADQFTVDLLPATAGNVWWLELVPGSHFTYNLRRVHTDRWFSVRFDLTHSVSPPEAPWGWTD